MFGREREAEQGNIWTEVGEDKAGMNFWEEVKRRAGWVTMFTQKVGKPFLTLR